LCLFTSASHLETALEAAAAAGIPESRVFLIPIPGYSTPAAALKDHGCHTLDDLLDTGRRISSLPREKWSKGRAREQAAYICYSSGTSGPPKGVVISHFNLIANILQNVLHELHFRPHSQNDVLIGVLPQSHIYSIVLGTQVPAFRGDVVVVMSKFELMSFVHAVNRHQATLLYVVPPILIALVKQIHAHTSTFDLPSVKRLFCGAAPLSEELTLQIRKRYPTALLGQGYGMTEAPSVIASHLGEVYDGAAGCLIPGMQARVVDTEGDEIHELNTPGELLVKGPNIAMRYYNNEKATSETFLEDGWLRTGDEVEMRRHPRTGDVHVFIVDRVKELIKVSGFQVAPAELEGHLLGHEMVADCAVIPVPCERSGEVPKALVVLKKSFNFSPTIVERELVDWVAQHKSKHKHLRGGVEVISEIPKSPSGKILRRFLRDRERSQQMTRAKL
jgi:acyl-CoA synthetase (AMP-forming)/AMP-acid ligase II